MGGIIRDKVAKFIKSTWTNINIRCGNGLYRHLATADKCASYEAVLVEMTREEWKTWCKARDAEIRALSRPSVDRIDNSVGYRLDNIRVCELAENIRKEKTVFRNGLGTCYRCKQTKPADEFVRCSVRHSGRATTCRPCERARSIEKNRRLGITTGAGRWPRNGSTGR